MTNRRMGFRKAKRRQVLLRLFLLGLSKNGKTYTSLTLALHLAKLMNLPPEAVGVADSEVDESAVNEQQGSAEKYEGEWCRCAECFGQGMQLTGYQTLLLPPGSHHPDDYSEAIAAARESGIKILVVDSASHEWECCKRLKDQAAATSSYNDWTAWSVVTPHHDRFIAALKSFPGHVIVTMRGKEKHEQLGKKVSSRGVLPVQRPGIEYEFDFGVFMSEGNGQIVGARANSLNGKFYEHPGKRMATDLLAWSLKGEAALRERAQGSVRAVQEFSQMDVRELKHQIESAARGVHPDATITPKPGVQPVRIHAVIQDSLKKAGGDTTKLAKLLIWTKSKANGNGAPDPTTGGETEGGETENPTSGRTSAQTGHTASGPPVTTKPDPQASSGHWSDDYEPDTFDPEEEPDEELQLGPSPWEDEENEDPVAETAMGFNLPE